MFNGCVCTYITHILTYWEKLSTLCVGYVVSSNDTNRYWRNKIRITHHHHIIHYQRNGFVNHFYLCVNVRSSCVHTHTFFVSSLHSTDSTAVRILYTSQWLLLLLLLLMVMVMASKAVKKNVNLDKVADILSPTQPCFPVHIHILYALLMPREKSFHQS